MSSYALDAGSTSEPAVDVLYTHARKDLAMTSNTMHFIKPEGALIHYPCACVHFFIQPVPAPNEIDAALE